MRSDPNVIAIESTTWEVREGVREGETVRLCLREREKIVRENKGEKEKD